MVFLAANNAQLWLIMSGFPDLLLNGTTTDPTSGLVYTIDAIDEGASWDAPVPIDTAVQRWMTDGAVASTQGHENRTPTFQVRVSAATSAALAAGEAALAQRSAQAATLKWISPEGVAAAPASIFDVWTWHMEHSFAGVNERHLERYYTLKFTAKPWVRSLGLTTVSPITPPGSPTTVLIDACTVTTGWAGTPNTVTASGGAVKETVTFTGGAGSVVIPTLQRTGSVTGMGTTPYLQMTMSITGGTVVALGVQANSTNLTKVAQIGTVSYWAGSPSSFTTLTVTAGVQTTKPSGGSAVLSIDDVSRTDTIGAVGSRKQLTRHIDVGGSVKTSGSIQVSSPSATGLGNTIIYTRTDDGGGYNPAMRQYRTSGNTVTADATCVSGNRELLTAAGGATSGTITYTMSASQLPESTYVVACRMIPPATLGAVITFTITAGSSGGVSNTTKTITSAQTTQSIVPVVRVLGVISLPAALIPFGSAVANTLTLSATATTGSYSIDELYLFDVLDGAFTTMNAGTATNLWIDAPDADLARNRAAGYVGSVADRSDAVGINSAFITALGDHDLDPGGTTLFTVTDGVNDAGVTVNFYRRWHTHAGS